MEFNNLNTMCRWEREKALYLVQAAEELGMNTEGYGELAVNPNSGYTYLWLEDYPFTLYLPIHCELEEKDVWVMWTDPEDGEEVETTLDKFADIDEIYEWVKGLEKGER